MHTYLGQMCFAYLQVHVCTAVIVYLSINWAILDDVAVDWINDKLYWVDSLWARIEVMDITVGGARERAEIIKLDGHTIPRGVAVDPNARYIELENLYY